MKRLSELITAAGLGIAILGGCCVDSPGIYGYAAGTVGILGGFVAGVGYTMMVLAECRKSNILYFPRPKEPVEDAGWIGLEAKK